MSRPTVEEILLAAHVVDRSKLAVAQAEQRRWGGNLVRVLVEKKLVVEEAMLRALSVGWGIPAVSLDEVGIEPNVIERLPGDVAEQCGAVPFRWQGAFLDVAMLDPFDVNAIETIRVRARLNVRPHLAGPSMIARALSRYYGRELAGIGVTLDGKVRNYDPLVSEYSQYSGVEIFDLEADQSGQVKKPGARRRRESSQSGAAQLYSKIASLETQVRDLQQRVAVFEALITRDEDVLRKLLQLLVEKGVASKDTLARKFKK